jgi:hypothetical protein
MEKRGLNKVDLIFEKIDPKEVLTTAYKMSSAEIIQKVVDSGVKVEEVQIPDRIEMEIFCLQKKTGKIGCCKQMKANPVLSKTVSSGQVAYRFLGEWQLQLKPVGQKNVMCICGEKTDFLFHSFWKELD